MRFLFFLFLMVAYSPAFAGSIGVVDFQRAVNETEEGKNAQKKLDSMFASRRAEIDRLKTDLEVAVKDFEARKMILSAEARESTERTLFQQQQQFEALYMQYQNEMQQNYYAMLQDLDVKMRSLTKLIAKEQSLDLVVDQGAVVYVGGDTIDLTNDLITRYNAL